MSSSSGGKSRQRLVAELAFVTSMWLIANFIAFRFIDLYERNVACRQHGLPFDVSMKFDNRATRLSGSDFGSRKYAKFELLPPRNQEFGKRYPLVLYLHGLGERGGDNIQQLRSLPALMASDDYRDRYPCFLVAPQCPLASGWWFARNSPAGERRLDELDVVDEILNDVIRSCAVDIDRIYVIGFSMGGYGAWELACRYPDRFAAVVPVAGGGDVRRAALLKETRIWAVHGENDEVVLPKGSREMIAAIRSAGGAPNYSELVGVGHGAWEPAFRDSHELLDWIFQQRRCGATLCATAS